MIEENKGHDSEAEGEPEKEQDIQDIDRRSIYIGNVDYSTSTEELRFFFKDCGNIERVTIPTDPHSRQPKGFAYLEFGDPASVLKAQSYNQKQFKGRKLTVMPKRTNLPGNTKRRFRGPQRRGYYYNRRPRRYRRY